MRICNLKSFVLGIMLLTVCMAWSQAGAVEIKYQFTKGENTQYRLSFSNNITVHAEQTKSDVMTHSYTFTEKVMRERPAGFSLDLSFDEVQYRPGKGAAEFDSRNPEHFVYGRRARWVEDLRRDCYKRGEVACDAYRRGFLLPAQERRA